MIYSKFLRLFHKQLPIEGIEKGVEDGLGQVLFAGDWTAY